MPTAELSKALAAFQAELPKIAKTEHADAGRFGYDYAGLDTVAAAVMPPLGLHGLAFTAFPGTDSEGRPVLDYALTHESGEERAGQFPLWLLLPDKFTAQQIGGYITYARRYCLCAVTGVAPGGEDDDAGGEAPEPSGRGGAWMNRRPDVPSRELQDKRTPAPVTGAEHEQLRDGTVEATPGDRPAKRARGTEPEGDPWLDQPAGTFDERPPEELPGSMNEPQRGHLFSLFASLGLARPTAQRDVLSDILKRPISSRKDLSYVDAEKVLKDLDARAEAKEAAEQAQAAAAGQDAAEVDAP